MKTHEQRPEQSSQQIPAQRKDRSLPVRDNRPESATQSQLFATVRSGQPSPLVSLVGQGRANHSPAMIQKKGVVQRGGWTNCLIIPCANGEASATATFIGKLKQGAILMKALKQEGIKIYSTIEDKRLIVTFFREYPPISNLFQIVKQYINFYANILKKKLIPSNQNTSPRLPVEEKKGSTLYLVGQGLFAVGTKEEFPEGFFTDGAGPCVAIAIKCENGVFALGHFDSDLNGNGTKKYPYDKTKIDDAIKRLYELMKKKNGSSDKWGQVEVILTRGNSWDKNLYGIYMNSIANYFGYVISQKQRKMGVHVNGNGTSLLKGQPNVYKKSFEHKTTDKNSTFMENLHSQSDKLNDYGAGSLIKSVKELAIGIGKAVDKIANIDMESAKNLLLNSKQINLQSHIEEGLKELLTEVSGKPFSEINDLKEQAEALNKQVSKNEPVFMLGTIINNYINEIKSLQYDLAYIKRRCSMFSDLLENSNNVESEERTGTIQKIDSKITEAEVKLEEAKAKLEEAKVYKKKSPKKKPKKK